MTLGNEMQVLDVHCHYSTDEAYVFRTEEDRERATVNFRREVELGTEAEMLEDLRGAGVRVMINIGCTTDLPIEEVRALHDDTARIISENRDVFIGQWIMIDPNEDTLEEFERCLTELDMGLVGFTVNGASTNVAASDEAYHPFYELCLEHNAPVHVQLGYTGIGARHPGGDGRILQYCHPKHVDKLAADFPEMQIIIGRPAWPWQSEAIATFIHKENIVGYELHGWSPRWWPEELKQSIEHRPGFQGKIMFASDYPIFSHDELYEAWEELDLSREQLEGIYHDNAVEILGQFDGADL
ncbi:amidohydrolase family protein [Haladaptatus sp. ZSTT2]|uniref:amidohydrolase family protein n=1 Tax=Haladaptatus sp. ZSTT2 TaxID=3120515 RepID=UPI00300F5A71